MSTLNEILENNIILKSNEDLGLIVTANGSYFQIWRQLERGFECLEAFEFSSRVNSNNGLYGCDTAKLLDVAEQVLQEFIDLQEGN